MKNFKKAVAALLCTVLAFSVSGCTSFKKPDKGIENPTDSASAYPEPSTHDISLQHTEQKAEKTTTPPIKVENTQSYVDPYARDAKIYTEYLTGGALDDMIDEYMDKNYVEIESCMADFNSDNIHELIISRKYTEYPGVMGYDTFYLIFTIKNGKVECIGESYYGGGSGGGNSVAVKYDTVEKKHILFGTEFIRDGAWANDYSETAYSFDGKQLSGYFDTTARFRSNEIEWYAEDIEKVKKESSFYYEEDVGLYYYKINGNYATKEEYNAAKSRFTDPTDSKYQMKKGTYSNPLGL